MRVLSICVGRPREVDWHGTTALTSIYKSPMTGPVHAATLNLEGDEQSDLTVHGGADKAVYVYPSEHYPFWRSEFPEMDLPWGFFGENFTIEGLLEKSVNIGDRIRVGTAEFAVTQPRLPCYKLGIRFGRDDIIKRFLKSGRTGFYLSVIKEGDVSAGDSIELLARDEHNITIPDIVGLYGADKDNQELLRRATRVPALPASWRNYFKERLSEAGESPS